MEFHPSLHILSGVILVLFITTGRTSTSVAQIAAFVTDMAHLFEFTFAFQMIIEIVGYKLSFGMTVSSDCLRGYENIFVGRLLELQQV